jgi:hypothetical protein
MTLSIRAFEYVILGVANNTVMLSVVMMDVAMLSVVALLKVVVKYLTHDPMIEGSYPAPGTEREKNRNKCRQIQNGAATLSITTFGITTLSITINKCDT